MKLPPASGGHLSGRQWVVVRMPIASIAETTAERQNDYCAKPVTNVSRSLERGLAGCGQNKTLDRSGRSGVNQVERWVAALGYLGR